MRVWLAGGGEGRDRSHSTVEGRFVKGRAFVRSFHLFPCIQASHIRTAASVERKRKRREGGFVRDQTTRPPEPEVVVIR